MGRVEGGVDVWKYVWREGVWWWCEGVCGGVLVEGVAMGWGSVRGGGGGRRKGWMLSKRGEGWLDVSCCGGVWERG